MIVLRDSLKMIIVDWRSMSAILKGNSILMKSWSISSRIDTVLMLYLYMKVKWIVRKVIVDNLRSSWLLWNNKMTNLNSSKDSSSSFKAWINLAYWRIKWCRMMWMCLNFIQIVSKVIDCILYYNIRIFNNWMY